MVLKTFLIFLPTPTKAITEYKGKSLLYEVDILKTNLINLTNIFYILDVTADA